MKKVLVTGGCGFIGSNFVRMLLEETELEVVNLDLLTYAGNPENLKDVQDNERYTFVKGDIKSRADVEKAMEGVDTVFHFAAESHVDNSINDSDPFIMTNVLGTKNMMDVAMAKGVEKFIHVSTDEVYGSVEEGSSTEKDLLEPRNPYSASKAASDLLVLSYVNTFDFNACITRSSNNYGPYQFPEKLIPLFVTNLMENKKVPVYGTGENIRDWLYVKDNCKGILIAGQKGKKGNIYNVDGGNELSNIELTKRILNMMGKGEEMIEHVEDRKGHDLRYSLDSSKLESFGWKPEKNFDEGLKETVEWYKNNESWWKPLKVKK
ncbi:MAG: dTDP-glucose 4,6-dehydratase [Candidatus Diapherotrites archaeon]|uniref:dTDP-glucose 4,6-dehydratase n=1 Tax=Candidatus Iainarchaeum sp. TaxID=3101447 RepID=A0A2D6LQJ5_9ARCH|nr:dTDP-glucose 4,6-dehydratase [Candidatus Diapherotrites archaeon]